MRRFFGAPKNMLNLIDKKIVQLYNEFFCLTGPMVMQCLIGNQARPTDFLYICLKNIETHFAFYLASWSASDAD